MAVQENLFNRSIGMAIKVAYVLSIALISRTLLLEHEMGRAAYLLFPLLMIYALFTQSEQRRRICALLAASLIFIGGLIEPLEMDAIEESFILLPLCFIILFPGSFWPLTIAALLIVSYLHTLDPDDFDEFIEDAIEVGAITVFATLMTYYIKKTQQQALAFKKDSFTDYLTKLPNINAFYAAVSAMNESNAHCFGVLQIGLHNFKSVNDKLGYRNGDELLQSFASHISGLIENQAQMYRIAGDEFVVLVENVHVERKLQSVLDTILTKHSKLFVVGDTTYRLNFCVGVALAKHANGVVSLWGKNANLALYRALSQGPGSVVWYDDQLLDETIRQHQLESEMKQSLQLGHFVLHYQPKVSMISDRVVGAEALIRWSHPQLGMISPFEFIPIAERTGFIVPLGRWVITQSIKQVKAWHESGLPILVSINVSTVQFAHDDVASFIIDALDNAQLPGEALQIEITESTLMREPEYVVEACERLRERGMSVAIDDFGIEYSSLNYLKRLPIDVLKIDKSFVDDCTTDITDHMLVRTIIQMGQNLGKSVVAEGVETSEQLSLLFNEGCDEYQGYFFSKPLDAQAFYDKVTQSNAH